jgi:hypothetical protein
VSVARGPVVAVKCAFLGGRKIRFVQAVVFNM